MAVAAESNNGQGGTIRAPELQGALVDRGVGFQAAGFTIVFFSSVAILETFEGSNFWLYQWFERATVDVYWAALIPLAALFDWVRKMFERGKAIREAKKAEIEEKAQQRGHQRGMEQGREVGLEQGLEQGREEGRRESDKRIRELLNSPGVNLPPEVAAAIFGDTPENGS